MAERIYYNKNKNIWVAYVNIDNKEKTIEYSVDKYGEYAKQLVLLTLEKMIEYGYIIHEESSTTTESE